MPYKPLKQRDFRHIKVYLVASLASLAIELDAMKTLLALLKSRSEGLPKKEKPRREKPLPSDWHHVVWQGNHMVMNHYPVWGYPVAHIMEDRMHKTILRSISELERLPKLDELKNALRTDETRKIISEVFLAKAQREMHEVDFEIGIQSAFNFMSEPLHNDVTGLVKKVRRGAVSAGSIIQSFYSSDYRKYLPE